MEEISGLLRKYGQKNVWLARFKHSPRLAKYSYVSTYIIPYNHYNFRKVNVIHNFCM